MQVCFLQAAVTLCTAWSGNSVSHLLPSKSPLGEQLCGHPGLPSLPGAQRWTPHFPQLHLHFWVFLRTFTHSLAPYEGVWCATERICVGPSSAESAIGAPLLSMQEWWKSWVWKTRVHVSRETCAEGLGNYKHNTSSLQNSKPRKWELPCPLLSLTSNRSFERLSHHTQKDINKKKATFCQIE